jgi:hypothetical protein
MTALTAIRPTLDTASDLKVADGPPAQAIDADQGAY